MDETRGAPARAIQRINHNAAICEDGAGHQLIALGRGIGFGDMPHEVNLEDVKRTFYGIDRKYLAFIDEVDPDVLEFSAQLADIVTQQVSYELSPNLPITLADHIQFALKRARDHLVVPMPLAEDVGQAHPVEYRLAQMAVRGMQKTFGVRADRHEAAGVAFGAFLRLKERDEKGANLGYALSGILGGVTEPALYGCGFKYMRSLGRMVIGGAIGGLIAGVFHVTTYVLGATNILGLIGYAGGGTANLMWGAISSVVAFVVAAAITFLFGFTKEQLEEDARLAAEA